MSDSGDGEEEEGCSVTCALSPDESHAGHVRIDFTLPRKAVYELDILFLEQPLPGR